ncbi:MAG: amidohydrolase family protein [Chloroflexi bacterium]|nr:amidohydrolase family protein [Chloroflexota bacterium]
MSNVPSFPPPLLLRNARWRDDPTHPRARQGTILLAEGRIAALIDGPDTDAERDIPSAVESVDLAGAIVTPGFVDTHTHLGWAGEGLWRVDWSAVSTRAEALDRLRTAAARILPGHWLHAGGWSGGWSRARLSDAELPTLAELDAATGPTPFFHTSADGGLAVCNSRALALFRLVPEDQRGALAPGGNVEVDADGRLTGRLFGAAAHARATLGAIPPADRARRRAELLAAVQVLARFGITEAHDIATVPDPGPTPLVFRERSFTDATLFDDLAARDELTVRIGIRPHLDRWEDAAREARRRAADPLVSVTGVKLLLDRAWYSEPLEGGYTYRYPGFAQALEWVRAADRAGLDVTIHAVGDLGVREALDLCQQASPTGGRRHRVSHARRVAPADIPRFAALGVVAEVQPWEIGSELPGMRQHHPAAFLETAYPLGDLLRSGARVISGSDWRLDQRADFADLDPLGALYAAATREAPNARPGDSPARERRQRLTLAEALHAATGAGAWAAHAEARRGRIAPGFQADLAILSRDILEGPPAVVLDTRVLRTIVGGRTVFCA